MDPPVKARKRVPNFTAGEKLLLARLVKKWPIIENKQSDGKIVARKQEAWQELTTEFNSHINTQQRGTTSLKKAWDNLKTNARKVKAEQSGSFNRTGNESSPLLSLQHEIVEATATAMIGKAVNNCDETVTLSETLCPELELSFLNPAPTAASDRQDTSECESDASDPFENGSQHEVETDVNQERKPSDYIKQEAMLRIRHFELKKEMEIQTLKSRLKVEEIRIKAAQLEEERNKILLQKAQLELEMLKKKYCWSPPPTE